MLRSADHWSQWAAAAYPARLAHYGMRPSLSRKGHGGDHAGSELWHRLLKTAGVTLRPCRTRAALGESIAVVCHRLHLHSALGYRPPQEAAPAALTA